MHWRADVTMTRVALTLPKSVRPLCTGWNFSWSTRLASAQGLLQLWVRVRERAPSL